MNVTLEHHGAENDAVMNDSAEETGEEAARKHQGNAGAVDEIIGLAFPDGRVRYCPKSMLVMTGGYFAARFGENGFSAGKTSRQNEFGGSTYFVARNGELFDKHILADLPPFSESPQTWRQLRSEAQFYALDELVEALQVTHSRNKDDPHGRGVLYWLGTNKGKSEYRNPQAIGAIAVHVGRIGDCTMEERARIEDRAGDDTIKVHPLAFTQKSRQMLVEYKPRVLESDENGKFYILSQGCFSLSCGFSQVRFPTIIDLGEIKLRLTAYSLRYYDHNKCSMTDWNFEGSVDGKQWEILHEARNDRHLVYPSRELLDMLVDDVSRFSGTSHKTAVCQEFAERELRHTWEVESVAFYRYFRIIGLGPDYEHAEGASTCLHGVGLELYGDVYEE